MEGLSTLYLICSRLLAYFTFWECGHHIPKCQVKLLWLFGEEWSALYPIVGNFYFALWGGVEVPVPKHQINLLVLWHSGEGEAPFTLELVTLLLNFREGWTTL